MRKIMRAMTVLLAVLSLVSCKDEATPAELFAECQSGVCVVFNSYYYEITLPDNTKMFCTGLDEDGTLTGLTNDIKEVEANRVVMSGTAFFIDKEGGMLTNRHVVSPIVPEEIIQKSMTHYVRGIQSYFYDLREECVRQISALEDERRSRSNAYGYFNEYFTEPDCSDIDAKEDTLKSKYSELDSSIKELEDFNPDDIKVNPVSRIGIAYNGTTVSSAEDVFTNNPCEVVRVSADDDVDLARIRLSSHTTPSKCHIFAIKGRDAAAPSFTDKVRSLFSKPVADSLTIGTQLIMIGFNKGIMLGNTQKGVQAQMTLGNVSQVPDGQRVLYSIPTMQGSSGSPVIDYNGMVRAVNFAKMTDSDNFNFGIPENKIIAFLMQ